MWLLKLPQPEWKRLNIATSGLWPESSVMRVEYLSDLAINGAPAAAIGIVDAHDG